MHGITKKAAQNDFFNFEDTLESYSWFSRYLEKFQMDEGAGWPDNFGNALREWNKKNRNKKIKTLSLFSGGGGLDIGFHDAGFDIIESVEIEKDFAKTLDFNSKEDGKLAGTRVVCVDINEYHPKFKSVDFIIGGPPCQTFSAAGARAAGVNGTDDERGNLFLQYARLINKLQPKGFLFENVYRIVGAQSGTAWKKIQDAFQELGYTLFWRILDSADYGVPQFRERLIIVGIKNGKFNFPYPSHGPDSPDNRAYYTAKNAVAGLTFTGEIKSLGGRHGHLLADIPPGLNYSFYTERMGHPAPIFAWRSKFSDYLYKAAPETPVRTIKAQGGQYTGPFSWENRPFTCDELKRLQTFPDDYFIQGNRQKIIHQLGNSVPPQFARILALSIMDQIFKEKIPDTIIYMSPAHQLGFRTRKSALTEEYSEKARKAILSKSGKKKVVEFSPKDDFEYFRVEDSFCVSQNLCKEKSQYYCSYRLEKNFCTMHISESKKISENSSYEIHITNPIKSKNENQISAKITSSSENFESLLAAWKYFEILLKRHYTKDDLVQLFGYYQYKNSYNIKMNIKSNKMKKSKAWGFIASVTEGTYVGAIIDIKDLSDGNMCSTEEMREILSQMKNLGYEIRNNNTNRQIKDNMILIPYGFPTLNERSLQRLTRL